MQKKSKSSGIVYSTEHGRMCPKCGNPATACSCRSRTTLSKGDGTVRVGWETKGRKGKGMTIITGVPLDAPALRLLAAGLKQKCGSGGTVKDGIIEIQGDQRDMIIAELKKLGYPVKRSGG